MSWTDDETVFKATIGKSISGAVIIVPNQMLETELCLCSSHLGICMILQPIPHVLMIPEENPQVNVKT
jgi:hypothetical protein